jgi:hypothetical protein
MFLLAEPLYLIRFARLSSIPGVLKDGDPIMISWIG